MNSRRPVSAGELRSSERCLIGTMQRLGFGRFERLKIQNGEPVLTPWPLTVRGIRFGGDSAYKVRSGAEEFTLKHKGAEML